MTLDELLEIKRSNPAHRIGVALSGGGIKGLCHAGALKALEELGIRPDVISGVSAGSVVGALYASGCTPDQIGELFMGISFRKSTSYDSAGGGFMNIKPFMRLIHKYMHVKRVEDLPIPLHIVATDLDHGKSVVFSEGDLLQCVAASCSVPVMFTPTIIGGVHYVDGGVLKNFPATTIRNHCDTLIGINASPMIAEDYKVNVATVLERVYHFMFKANIVHDREVCDLLLEPQAMGMYDTFDVEKSEEIFQLGYNYTREFFNVPKKMPAKELPDGHEAAAIESVEEESKDKKTKFVEYLSSVIRNIRNDSKS